MDGEDECGPYPMARYSSTATDRVSVEDVSYKEYPNLASSEHFDFADTKNSGNVIRHSPPRNKQYSLEQNRFKSFKEKNWPIGLTQTPEQLANAGFYYLGKGDQVLCFYCEGGLQNWEANDDPWEEHAKHFPGCGFLNVTKSPDYVRTIHENLRRTSNDRENPLTSDEIPNRYSRSCSYSSNSGSSDYSKSPESSQTSSQEEETRGRKHFDVCIPEKDGNKDSKKEDKELIEENKRLRDERLCKICADKDLGVVFIPCGHLVTCTTCAASLNNCPVCRSTITSLVKTYMS